MFTLGLSSLGLAKLLLPLQPAPGVYALEFQVRLLHTSLSILPFALIVLGLGVLSSDVSKPAEKYWLGAASGFILAALAAALINPGKEKNWTASFVEKKLAKTYKTFVARDPGVEDAREIPKGVARRWVRYGIENQALLNSQYMNEEGNPIRGWGYTARHARGRTLQAGIKEIRTPK